MKHKNRIICLIFFCFFLIKNYANENTIQKWILMSVFSLYEIQSSFVNSVLAQRNLIYDDFPDIKEILTQASNSNL